MERQIINKSIPILLDNFLKSHPNANISTILDYIVQEGFQEKHQKLFIEYVTHDFQKFWEMLLIINFDETSQNSKYPFIVTEIIKSKSEQIFDFLFQLNQIEFNDSMNFLFSTIDSDCLDETIAGYFSKFICTLIKIRGLDLWSYLQTNGKYIYEDLMKNIHINHIAYIVYNLIALTIDNGNPVSNYKENRLYLLNRTIDILLNKHYDQQIVENVCNILSDLLKNVIQQDFKQLILEKIYIPHTLFDLIFLTKSPLLVDLLIQLLNEVQQFTINSIQFQPDFEFDYHLFEGIGNKFGSALTMELNIQNFVSTYGVSSDIMGLTKLKLIEFYYTILQSNNLSLINYFNHSEIYLILMDFIQKYEFNNQLQNYFMQITVFIFCNQNLAQIQQLIFNTNILGFLCFLNKEYLKQVGEIRKPITKGYHGMANKLSYFFQGMIYSDEWNQYIENHQQIFYIENNYLFGIAPGDEYSNQQENQKKPQQEEKQEEPRQIETEKNLTIQLNNDQVQSAVVQAENNFQDQSNFGEVFGEQILHQITKKQKNNISKSGSISIPTNFDFGTRFLSKSDLIIKKKHTQRKSLSQEKVQKQQGINSTQSEIFYKKDEKIKGQIIIN